MFDLSETRIGIIGLGYVGLPLAVEFGHHFPTVGYDIKQRRIEELRNGRDSTMEVSADALRASNQLRFTEEMSDLASCNTYIVSVPTPVNVHKLPDLSPLQGASRTVGAVIKPGDVVIYESTVFPGATEEVCVPIIEAESGLIFNQDFFVGYSPERINPGDKEHTLTTITKITSGSTPEAAAFVDALYQTIITGGTHRAGSIRVAEAAKVIENTQRDVNIALVNELALIFNRLGIDTEEVLEAARSKWNFLPFRPGLVGGHCIGVDPYYLTHKALEAGYQPKLIPASRLLNDSMGEYVANQLIRLMAGKGISVVGGRLLVMGLAFKENCPDLRNTRSVDIINTLREYNAHVDVYDPWVDEAESLQEYGIRLVESLEPATYDGILIAVGHNEFRALGIDQIRALGRDPCVIYDAKCLFPAGKLDGRL